MAPPIEAPEEPNHACFVDILMGTCYIHFMKVFISHASQDDELARKIAEVLRAGGLEVWDDQNILPGDNWAGQIAQALDQSQAMVILLTPQSLASEWVRRDIDYALGKEDFRKRVFPVVVGQLSEESLPWILRRLHMIRLAEPPKQDEDIQRIADALREAC